jgi:hypothetical protein
MAFFLFVAGCGDSESTLSQKEYEKQLVVVCNQGEKESNDVLERISNLYYEGKRRPTREFQTENLRKMMRAYEATTENISEIGLPERGKEAAEALVESREEGAAKAMADIWGTRNDYLVIFKDANERAKAYGVEACML